VSERLNLLLGMVLDVHGTVTGHEKRIAGLEVYPSTAGRVLKFLLGLGGLLITSHAVYQIFLK